MGGREEGTDMGAEMGVGPAGRSRGMAVDDDVAEVSQDKGAAMSWDEEPEASWVSTWLRMGFSDRSSRTTSRIIRRNSSMERSETWRSVGEQAAPGEAAGRGCLCTASVRIRSLTPATATSRTSATSCSSGHD